MKQKRGKKKEWDEEKYKIAIRAIEAIKELHDKNILHLDIKPENFMLDRQGRSITVAAIDFGLSMKLKEGEETIKHSSVGGTLGYIAPELGGDSEGNIDPWDFDWESMRPYSKAADIFALGMMLEKDLNVSNSKDENLKHLVRWMTADNPEDRPNIDIVLGTLVQSATKKFDDIIESTAKYIARKQHSWIRLPGIKATAQKKMAGEIQSIIGNYIEAEYGDGNQDEYSLDATTDKILKVMKENQSRHEKTQFAKASTFNLTTLQKLPDELKNKVAKKLGISEEDQTEIFSGTSHATRKKLAQIISKYEPPKPKRESGLDI